MVYRIGVHYLIFNIQSNRVRTVPIHCSDIPICFNAGKILRIYLLISIEKSQRSVYDRQ